MAADAASRIHSGSSTNLSGGLLEGICQLAPGNGSEADVKSVLLLTDGHANRGNTDQEALVSCVEGANGQVAGDVTLFTFGYGSDHNADLMRAVSDAGKGVYYYVEAQDDIANAFGDCLGGLLSVAAQNVKLLVEAAVAGVTIKQIHSKRKVTVLEEGRKYEVDMGDLYAEEQRDLLVELALPAAAAAASDEPAAVASFELKYVDTFTGGFETARAAATVARPAAVGDGPEANPASLHVAEQFDRVVTARAIEEAKAAADAGRHAEGQQILRGALGACAASPAMERHSTMMMVSDLQQAVEQCSSRDMYERQGKYSMASKSQSHHQQRSNTSKCGGSEEVYRAVGSKKSAMRMKMKQQHDDSPSRSPAVKHALGGAGGGGIMTRKKSAPSGRMGPPPPPQQQQQQCPPAPEKRPSGFFGALSSLGGSVRASFSGSRSPPPTGPSSA
jgi:hypothetical protein